MGWSFVGCWRERYYFPVGSRRVGCQLARGHAAGGIQDLGALSGLGTQSSCLYIMFSMCRTRVWIQPVNSDISRGSPLYISFSGSVHCTRPSLVVLFTTLRAYVEVSIIHCIGETVPRTRNALVSSWIHSSRLRVSSLEGLGRLGVTRGVMEPGDLDGVKTSCGAVLRGVLAGAILLPR